MADMCRDSQSLVIYVSTLFSFDEFFIGLKERTWIPSPCDVQKCTFTYESRYVQEFNNRQII